MLFDGMVPVLTHTPPSIPPRSITATFLPSSAAATAAFCPPGPEPMTTRSYSLIRIAPQHRNVDSAFHQRGFVDLPARRGLAIRDRQPKEPARRRRLGIRS